MSIHLVLRGMMVLLVTLKVLQLSYLDGNYGLWPYHFDEILVEGYNLCGT